MPGCDAVLVGVEFFYSDGYFTNTVGSLTTAIVANRFAVPFYAVTELTKTDPDESRFNHSRCENSPNHSQAAQT